MSRFAYEFTGRIAAFELGPWTYSVIYLPDELARELPLKEHPRLRVRGEIGEYPFAGAWQPAGGRWYLKLSRDMLKRQEASVGDWLNVRFNVDDQDAVDVPEALVEALRQDKKFAKAWGELTPGKRRSWLLPVLQAKTAATVAKRIEALRSAVLERQ